MSSTDLSTTILWQSLSKDVYSYGKYEDSKSNPATIMEVSEELESQPLLEKDIKQKKKSKGNIISEFLFPCYKFTFVV